jgi:D-3-phosphoglycerate dehydrogenase / 2-oxoglutarate reductase
MAANSRRVFYVHEVADPIYLEVIAKEESIQIDKLENNSDDAAAAPVLAAAHGYQIQSGRHTLDERFHLTRDLIGQMPNLLIASTNGSGADTIDIDACTEAGIVVVNQAGGNREAVAEHAVAMMIALSKGMFLHDRALRSGVGFVPVPKLLGTEICGKTIGIVGLGNVGSRIAEICRTAFGMRVLARDPYLSRDEIERRGAEETTLDDLFRQSDYVSINCPRNAETLNIVDDRAFALMKPGVFFIMTARGGICDEAALERALRSGKVAGAGIDVWWKEPPPSDHPLLTLDNVIATGHLAGGTREARTNLARIAAEQMIGLLNGEYPPRILNPAVWPVYSERFRRILGTEPAAGPE